MLVLNTMKIQLQVSLTGARVQEFAYITLSLNSEKTASLFYLFVTAIIADCSVILWCASRLAPTLFACRAIGVKPVYLYNRSRPNRLQDMLYEIHHSRRGKLVKPSLSDPCPNWAKIIKPHPEYFLK